MAETEVVALRRCTIADTKNSEGLGSWVFFTATLRNCSASTGVGKSFRWANAGPLPIAFDNLLDKIADLVVEGSAAPPLPSGLSKNMAKTVSVNLSVLVDGLGFSIKSGTFLTKIKDWENGGTRYTRSNRAHVAPTDRHRAMLDFLRRESDNTLATDTTLVTSACVGGGGWGGPSNSQVRCSTSPSSEKNVVGSTPAAEAAVGGSTDHPANLGTAEVDQIPPNHKNPPQGEGALREVMDFWKGKRAFVLPEENEVEKWKAISGKVQAGILADTKNLSGADALDLLHISIVDTLSALGLEKSSRTARGQQLSRTPLKKALFVAKQEVGKIRKVARKTGSFEELWATLKVQKKIGELSEEVKTAKKIRSNHKLLAQNPKK